MLRLRFIWVFKPIFLFNIFNNFPSILLPLYRNFVQNIVLRVYIGTLKIFTCTQSYTGTLLLICALRVILELCFFFLFSEL